MQKIMYLVDLDKKTCQESTPTGPFQPIEVPDDAHFVAEVWIGVEGLVGAGFSTNLWVGTTPYGTYIHTHATVVGYIGNSVECEARLLACW